MSGFTEAFVLHSLLFRASSDTYRPAMFNLRRSSMQVLFLAPRPARRTNARPGRCAACASSMRRLNWLVPRAYCSACPMSMVPRGDVDKRCQIHLRTDGRGTVVVTSGWRGDWRTALDSALSRATRLLRAPLALRSCLRASSGRRALPLSALLHPYVPKEQKNEHAKPALPLQTLAAVIGDFCRWLRCPHRTQGCGEARPRACCATPTGCSA